MRVESFLHPLMIEIGGRLSYVNTVITTPENPTRTVLCLHDFTARGAMFQPLADQLAAQGSKVVAPDMPGRGQSQRLPPDLYTWQTYVNVLAAVLRLHNLGPLVILGVGWGALLALGLENLWRPKPAKLVLCDLPLAWQFTADPRAQILAQLCAIIGANDQDVMDQARRVVQAVPELAADILRDVARRVTGPVGARSLGTDPHVFDTLPRGPNAAFNCDPLLRASTTPTELILSKSAPSWDAAGRAQSHHLTVRRISTPDFFDLSEPATLRAVQHAILAGATLAP